MQSDIFPSYAVKQALKELDIEREDDAIITGIQNELLPQCAVMLIKNCILSAIHNNRKFVGAVDIQFAISTVHIPKGEILSENVGYLMNTKHFGSMAFSMLQIISASFETYGIKADDKKISSECILILQSAAERLIRGFLLYFKKKKKTCYDYKLFDTCMDDLFGKGRGDVSHYKLVVQ